MRCVKRDNNCNKLSDKSQMKLTCWAFWAFGHIIQWRPTFNILHAMHTLLMPPNTAEFEGYFQGCRRYRMSPISIYPGKSLCVEIWRYRTPFLPCVFLRWVGVRERAGLNWQIERYNKDGISFWAFQDKSCDNTNDCAPFLLSELIRRQFCLVGIELAESCSVWK